MVIQEVYEKFKHLDHFLGKHIKETLSDKEWLLLTNNILYAILYNLWQAIKEAAENNSDEDLEYDINEGDQEY